jgi:hypothetical protein
LSSRRVIEQAIRKRNSIGTRASGLQSQTKTKPGFEGHNARIFIDHPKPPGVQGGWFSHFLQAMSGGYASDAVPGGRIKSHMFNAGQARYGFASRH